MEIFKDHSTNAQYKQYFDDENNEWRRVNEGQYWYTFSKKHLKHFELQETVYIPSKHRSIRAIHQFYIKEIS